LLKRKYDGKTSKIVCTNWQQGDEWTKVLLIEINILEQWLDLVKTENKNEVFSISGQLRDKVWDTSLFFNTRRSFWSRWYSFYCNYGMTPESVGTLKRSSRPHRVYSINLRWILKTLCIEKKDSNFGECFFFSIVLSFDDLSNYETVDHAIPTIAETFVLRISHRSSYYMSVSKLMIFFH
jgi:hypothetical protein